MVNIGDIGNSFSGVSAIGDLIPFFQKALTIALILVGIAVAFFVLSKVPAIGSWLGAKHITASEFAVALESMDSGIDMIAPLFPTLVKMLPIKVDLDQAQINAGINALRNWISFFTTAVRGIVTQPAKRRAR